MYFPSVAGVSTTCGVSRYLIRISLGLEEVAALWQRLDAVLKLPHTLSRRSTKIEKGSASTFMVDLDWLIP